MLDSKTTSRVENFTAAIGISPEYFLSRIVNEWLDEKGEDTLRRVNQMRKSNDKKPSRRATRSKASSSKVVKGSSSTMLHLHRRIPSVELQVAVP